MLKNSDIRGFLIGVLVVAAVAVIVLWRVLSSGPLSRPSVPMHKAQAVDCEPSAWQAAASANKAALYRLAWSPFGKAETGWATYAPLISHEIGTSCPADTTGFAAKYAQWQAQQHLTVDGVVKPADFDRLRDTLALRRPFVQLTAKGVCPAAPDEATLVSASPAEAYRGKAVRLRPAVLAAYRKMVAAARRDGIGAYLPSLQLISGYRSPAEEAVGCRDGGCNKLTRASCSAHRTGLAIDLYLEPAPGADPTSTADENRRHMAGTAEYRWLVANANRFGFLPYAYEPWHWEWAGETP